MLSWIKKWFWFCGNNLHWHINCPPKDCDCSSCGRLCYWTWVFPTKNKNLIEIYFSNLDICSQCYSCWCSPWFIVDLTVNWNRVSGLIDSTSTERFIDKNVAEKLKLTINPIVLYSHSHFQRNSSLVNVK